MAHLGGASCHRCGPWSSGSAPIIIVTASAMHSSRVRAHAVHLDCPPRTEQRNGGDLVVMGPYQRPRSGDNFVKRKNAGNVVVMRPDRKMRDDLVDYATPGNGRAPMDIENVILSPQAKQWKCLGQNSDEGVDLPKDKGMFYAGNLRRYCNNGKLIQACCVIDEMVLHGQIPDSKCCNRLIRGLVKTGKTNKARDVLEVMVLSGGIPGTITCNMLIAQLCCTGQLNYAMNVLEDMRYGGSSPSGITFNTD
ncbi:hypothetical protein ACQ4PT_000830 [Festuca glaucescens]